MSRKTGSASSQALPDSTYLLPVFGVEVRGLTGEAILPLRSSAIEKQVILYYTPISFIEIVAKIAKERMRKGYGLEPDEMVKAIRAIEEAEYLKPVYPDQQASSLAY